MAAEITPPICIISNFLGKPLMLINQMKIKQQQKFSQFHCSSSSAAVSVKITS
jgi:hypothetical protein